MKSLFLRSEANISNDGLYRYWLHRSWNGALPHLVWLMANPSTANACDDDPTIRRCMSFAERDTYGGINVVNLFALRSPDVKALAKASDPVGPENDAEIRWWCQKAKVVVAWGSASKLPKRLRGRIAEVHAILRDVGAQVLCLGTTGNGDPLHPLFLAGNTPLIPYEAKP